VKRLIVAVGLMSSSALLLKLELTRLFSVALFYHFALDRCQLSRQPD
jgi:hypothetical protein